ncbi:glycosyltransferase family 4 protein [Microbulbifer marinus]|uniref:Glycosyltransferase involved in cell wall bisynthesis n=1 Tax=Microbulbifer marinus TaxID=658218 RepID=A0A1H3VV25_9GAMM|nr:glycosyltransferase [Microbulbifer marinus]SDZ78637.1 Glycosyltransferase involved in cell wall bisynthesis [Microbulbifer marinus]
MSQGVKERYGRIVIVDPQLKDCKGHNYRYAKGIAEELGLPAVVLSHRNFDGEGDNDIDVRPCLSFDQYNNSAFKDGYRPSFFEKLTRFKDHVFTRLKQDNGIWEKKSPLGTLVNIAVAVGNFLWFFPALFHQLYLLTFGRGTSAHTDLAAMELQAAFERVGLRQGDLLVMQTMLWPTFESLLELKIQANKNYGCDALFIVHEDWTIYNTMYARFSPAKLEKRVLESLPFRRAKIVSTNKPLSDYCQEWCGYYPQVVNEISFPLAEGLPHRNIDDNGKRKVLIPGVYRGDKNFESLEQLIAKVTAEESDVEFCIHESVMARVQLPSQGGCTYAAYSSVNGAYAWLEFLSQFHLILIPYGQEYRHRISGIVHEARLLNIPVVCHSGIADASLLADERCTYGNDGERIAEAIQIAASQATNGTAFKPERAPAIDEVLLDKTGWVEGREKPIAVQVKPAWTRCGTSVVLDTQMDCLVEQGYFVIEIYLKTEPWLLRQDQVDNCYQVMRAGREFSGGMAVRVLLKNVTLARLLSYMYRLARKRIRAFFERENIHSTWCDPDVELVDYFKKNRIELALVNHIFNDGFARKNIPAQKFICETHDVQINQLLLRRPELKDRYDSELDYELQLLKSYDAVVNLNRIEHKMIQQVVGEKAHFIPPPIKSRPMKRRYRSIQALLENESQFTDFLSLPDRLDLLIIADGHPANIKSVEGFLNDVFPELQQGITLGLVGTIGKHIKLPRESKGRIFVFGYVENLANIYDFTKVMVLPDIAGEGIPIKTNEVLALGVPFVATSHALRAFSGDELRTNGVLSADTPACFARKLTALLRDTSIWKAQREGINRLTGVYSWARYMEGWKTVLPATAEKKSISRSEMFIKKESNLESQG